MKYFIAFSVLIGILFSCSSSNKNDFIDNPTNKDITFKLDGKEITLKANSKQEISLEAGTHTLSTPSGEEIKFKKEDYEYGSILNPTKSNYIIVTESYTETPIEKNTPYLIQFKSIEVEGQKYYAPANIVNDYYIAHYKNIPWKFGLDESFPETLEVEQNGENYNLMISKIFRTDEFIKEYKDYMEK